MTPQITTKIKSETSTSDSQETVKGKVVGNSEEVESIFERALRAKSERGSNAVARVTKAPGRIRPTKRIKGWFRNHPTFLVGPMDIFYPKDEGGFSDEPIFIFPNIADELRAEGSLFENAVHEMLGHLVFTMGGALYLVLVPVPDPATGRHHAATEQKIDALEAARTEWKRLDWNKNERQYDDLTAEGITTEPKWPEDISEASILNRAFGERNVIKSVDDPLIIRFRGEA